MYHKVRSSVARITMRLGINRAVAGLRARTQTDAVFIWIPKSAGTSMWMALANGRSPLLRTPEEVRRLFPNRGLVTFGHQLYSDLVLDGYVSREFDQKSFKFTFVRNPFDRVVSLYHYLKRTAVLHRNTSFRTFCYLIRDRAFDAPGLFNHRGLSQCSQQLEWIRDRNGSEFVDFIGRFEDLGKDFRTICQRVGVSRSLQHLNSTEHRHYSSYYDDECREIIATAYSDDCERFGYVFEDAAPPHAPSLV